MSFAIKIKIKEKKSERAWLDSLSRSCGEIYNECLSLQFERASQGEKLLSKFDLIQTLRDKKEVSSDYKDKVCERAARATLNWYRSEKLRYEVFWDHIWRRDKEISEQRPKDTFERSKIQLDFQSEYRKHKKNLFRKQKLFGKPRKQKKLSLKFAIRKNRQDTVSLKVIERESSKGTRNKALIKVPGKKAYKGLFSGLLPENSTQYFKEGILKRDRCGQLWCSIVVEGDRQRLPSNPKPGVLVGIDCGLKTARTVVSVCEKSGEILDSYQPARERFFDKQLNALKKASNGDKRALPFVHRKIARRRHDQIEKDITKVLSMGDRIKVGKPSSAWLLSGRLARSASDVANSKFVERLAKRAETAGKKSSLVNESYTTVTCRMCGATKKMSLRDRIYKCEAVGCNHVEDRDLNSAYQIAFRPFVESS